jgi:hypothetical protein
MREQREGDSDVDLVDDYTRECPAIEVDNSLGALRVRRVLDRMASERGLPEAIVVDNGPECRGRALAPGAARNILRPQARAFVASCRSCGDWRPGADSDLNFFSMRDVGKSPEHLSVSLEANRHRRARRRATAVLVPSLTMCSGFRAP